MLVFSATTRPPRTTTPSPGAETTTPAESSTTPSGTTPAEECAEEDVRTFEDFVSSPRPKTRQDKALFTSKPGKRSRVDLKLKDKTMFIPYTLDVSLTNVAQLTVRFVYADKTKVDMVSMCNNPISATSSCGY
eukprot:TRINITY_DN29799_c0_g1_i2.p1 TRINITY_DN29799_c0_g1~~TRINITY_DN29799_c0_g1_i2.p1  ORF type:complete len:133 (+),score=30.04 TRINITY_DN29799_c0_g1_i2:206-604(+)